MSAMNWLLHEQVTIAGSPVLVREIVGNGLPTNTVCVLDVPPPGPPLMTVTCPTPCAATSAAEIVARSCVPLTNVVGRSAPFHLTMEPPTNPVPSTVTSKVGAPGGTKDGDTDVTEGAGLLTTKEAAAETPPAGLKTVTDTVPATAMSAAGIGACSVVALTNVVGVAAPFHRTTDVATKPAPLTVNTKLIPPAVVPAGTRLATLGGLALGGGLEGGELPELPPHPATSTAKKPISPRALWYITHPLFGWLSRAILVTETELVQGGETPP